MKKTTGLLVGSGGVDITPPVGVSMVGALTPRPSIGIDDPLMVKAIVLESGGTRVAGRGGSGCGRRDEASR